MPRCNIYLVPGFFGFTSLGSFNYFHRVSETIKESLLRFDLDATIVETPTQPTGSITRRAERLLETVVTTGGLEADEIHFVGHSTGGLDIRLLVTPGVRICQDRREIAVGDKVRSVVTLATPHFGTPLANFFTTVQGRRLLQALTLLATTRSGRYAIYLATQAVEAAAKLDDLVGRTDTLLDKLSQRLLEHLTLEKDDPIWEFLHEVSTDQGAIIQLTPEGMHLYNAAVVDRPGVRYGSMITAAPPPLAYRLTELWRPVRLAMVTVFAVLHQITAREHSHYPYPSPAAWLQHDIQARLPFTVGPGTNDGIVPTLSQVYGELIDVVVADHLDVVGQFRDSGGDPLSDWLPSGSRFDQARFQGVWDGIAQFIAKSGEVVHSDSDSGSNGRASNRG